MAEYILRESVIAEANHNKAVGMAIADIVDIKEILNDVPAADVEPVKHGYWICENLGFGVYRYRCSECGNIYGQDQIEKFKHSKFCGDCGARMDTE